MFGNGGNSFGALAMDDDQPSAGPSCQVVEGDESDVDWLQLVKTNHDVDVRVSDKVDLEGLPLECNLMVVSNVWDLIVVGGNDDVRIHRLSDFHGLLEGAAKDASPTSTPIQIIGLSARPVWIRLAMNEERLVVATANGAGIHVFKLKEVLSGDTSPYHSFTTNIPSQLLDVLPNPAAAPTDQHTRLLTLLAPEGLVVADIEDCRLAAPLSGPFTCASWSAKGKQIVVGTPSGKLIQYTPEGTAKAEIPSPPDLESYHPVFAQWLENDLFFVSYAQENAQPDDPVETYIMYRNKSEFTFTKFFDPLNTMGLASRASFNRHFAGLKAWGDTTKHIALIVSGASSEIGVLHGSIANEREPPKWEVLLLEETARGVLPAAKAGVRDDASVLALALDLTSNKKIQRGIVGGIELPDLPPQPRLLAYTQEGTVISFDVRYPDAGLYQGMITPQDIISSSPGTAPANQPASSDNALPPSSTNTSAPAAFGGSAFGQNSSSISGNAFGVSAFGQSSTPAFGSSSKPAAFGASAFGQPSTSSPSSTPAAPNAFGSSSKPNAFSGFGQSSNSSGFGQSAFGQSAKPSAFGSASTPSAFGASTTPTSTPAKPAAFGSTSAPVPAFGSSSSPTSKPSAFGSSAFGVSSTPGSAFGQSAFGQSSKPAATTANAFGTSSTPSAFGSTPTPSGSNAGFSAFGSTSKPAGASFGFGGSAFGQAAKTEEKPDKSASPFGSGGSAFGSSSAFGSGGSAFGSTSAFGQKSTSSPSTEPPKPAFTGFGPKSTEGQQPPSTSAFSGFGQKAVGDDKPSTAFGGFGQSAKPETSKSAFGGFGTNASQTSAFGAFGQPNPPSPSPETSKDAEQDDFGLGGFASALDKSTQPAGIPGLGESPPGSPVHGSSKKAPGLEDDTPPQSPPTKPAVSQAAATSTPSTSSSFIKPATAFGGAPSVGAFGQAQKSSTPAFGPASTPTAFATPPSSSPSAFGSSGFGKPSTTGSSSPSAFGSSGFGQSSVPVGLGKSSLPATNKPIGNISGGFGAFGSKSDSEKKPAGFGGFASSGTSVFGGGSDKDKKPSGFAGFGGSGTSVFGTAAEKKEKPASAFGTATPTPAFSLSAKPATSTPPQETPAAAAPPTPEKEVKGYEIPSAPEQSKEESTTPTATPIKKSAVAQSTTPDSTPNKSTELISTTTPGGEPAKTLEPPTPEVDEEDVYHVEAGAAFLEDGQGTEEEYEDEYEEEGEHDDYDDYEDDEEYDDGQEDEEEEEEEAPTSGRRRSTSIPPDMSPIKEEVSDELASEDEEGEAEGEVEEEPYEEEASKVESEVSTSAKALTKSPPTWFAKPFKTDKGDDEPVSPTSGSEGASLFARPSPAPSPSSQEEKKEPVLPAATTPAQPKLPPSFSFKHASRTSSPLSGPPENASTTPESSPAKPPAPSGLFGTKPADQNSKEESKPATSAFGLFGKKPAENNKDLSAAPPAFTGFGGFGAKPAETKTEEAKPASAFSLFGNKTQEEQKEPSSTPNGAFNFFGTTNAEISKPASPIPAPVPATGGFNLFGSKPAEPVNTTSPLFGAAKTVPSVPVEAPKPAFSLGLGKPASIATPSPLAEKKPSMFGTPAPAAAPIPPPSAPVAPSKFTLSTRESVPLPPSRPEVGSKSMGAIVEKIILASGDDIANIKAILEANAKYHKSFNMTDIPPINTENLASHDIIAFSSISQLADIVEDLRRTSHELRNDDNGTELKLAELQSRMLKTDMKTGQADKFLKARQDPSFAKVMQIKDLSPEQASSQLKLRKAVQVAETKIEELEASIAGLKRRAEMREQGRGNSQQPALERVQRSVRNIDAAIRDRQQTIDDLARRIGGIRLASPSRAGSPTPSSTLRHTPRKSTIPSAEPRTISFEPSKEILKEVDSALNGNDRNRLIGRLEKVKSARLTKLETKANTHSKTIMIDALPLPGQLPPSLNKSTSSASPLVKAEPQPEVVDDQPTSTPIPSTPSIATNNNTTPSPSSFGSIRFNLDPGNISDLAKSTGGSTHRGGGGSTRSHTSAAKYVPGQSNSPSSAGGGGLFDFHTQQEQGDEGWKKDASEGKGKPSGFFR
uniref:Nucleoporin Nup159/Nup146 N-terminal domain-containing protein n=1 Tax=Kwoniella bestiolae CBS 10118 TaxID=1296100 RepID=A0A1B9G6F0_9TREE|nr:hypothetical protein I302_04259 [Kwoniella bestiolae CBS 10118]OCF26573.1 hypothetical protein I302_04259 [Kwoniella bestiolae CBS 10118]